MSITPQLRALIKEREAEPPRRDCRAQIIMGDINAAAARVDAGFNDPTKWKPSERIKLGYFVIATAGTRDCERRAEEFVRAEIARAQG